LVWRKNPSPKHLYSEARAAKISESNQLTSSSHYFEALISKVTPVMENFAYLLVRTIATTIE